jgi:hypothetical protein
METEGKNCAAFCLFGTLSTVPALSYLQFSQSAYVATSGVPTGTNKTWRIALGPQAPVPRKETVSTAAR